MPKTYFLNRPDSLIEDSWLGLGDLNELQITNQLMNRATIYKDNPGLLEISIMQNPNYLTFAAKLLLNVDLLPEQGVILHELWTKAFPMYIASRGFGKSFLMALYGILKMILCPGVKIVGVGSAFRQSRIVFDYMVTIWENAPILQSVCNSNSGPRTSTDRCIMRMNDSIATFVPLGDGSKIRGLRANVILADEFASIPPHIYEVVVRGFAAVSAKPIDNVKEVYRRNALKAQGRWSEEDEVKYESKSGNQCVISGTADYDFMHYADYWKRYWTIINSQGDLDKPLSLPSGEAKTLRDYYPDGLDDSFSPHDYCVMRIPYEVIPKGFMDDKVVGAAKAASHKSNYLREYGACFPSDSDGFFKRSLIQACVTSDIAPIELPSGNVYFDALMRGIPGKQYVIGIDPAAEKDNFAIVVLEVNDDHTRIVHVWSTNIAEFQKRRKKGLVKENDYYGFCARKIRNLMKVFPTDNIVIDAQGGGRAIQESLHDSDKMMEGELKLWPTTQFLDPGKKLESDNYPGKHILHMFEFSNFKHLSEANHGTRKDFEDRTLLFPRFDSLSLELAGIEDNLMASSLGVDKLYDTLEDNVYEIEELKDELCTITMTRSPNGNRDRWDTPETSTLEGKKTRMRKDRYSALVICNYIARSMQRAPEDVAYNVIGGFAHDIRGRNSQEEKVEDQSKMYTGPDWYVQSMKEMLNRK